MIHSFLLIGQSNMAGRGFKEDVEPIQNKNLKVLRNGRWQPMYFPVNPDRPFAGVNLAESFADQYARKHNVEVGLIPCADGGTMLDQWQSGSLLYDNAVYQARLAQRTSTIAGVLWHQGESDCDDGKYQLYEEKFLKIMAGFRRDLNLYDVPFLLGGLGDYLVNFPEKDRFVHYTDINQALKKMAEEQPMTGFVSAEGLASNPDFLHFSASSLREFGLRYYEVFEQLADPSKTFEEKQTMDGEIRSELESL